MPKSKTDSLKDKLRSSRKIEPVDWSMGLSTGSTLLNLACSGRTSVGVLPGHLYLLVGDSGAGKTWLARTILAEASLNPKYNRYRFIDDNPERGALMDDARFFGSKMADRLEPASAKGHSVTSSDFYANVDAIAKDGKPFIYILDSEDALKPDGGEKEGWNTGKAIRNSSGLREANNGLEDSGSILIVIKQTRDNIGPGAMFKPKTRSGGRALTFYSTLEIWFSLKGKRKKKVANEDMVIGDTFRLSIVKNRESGKIRSVEVPFYPDSGIDDVGSMVEFLVKRGHWKRKGNLNDDGEGKGPITAPEFNFEGRIERLVEQIEEQSKEKELRLLVSGVWANIEKQCSVNRKRKYQ